MKAKDTKEYNGWTNWATWNVSLWLNNDEFLYRQMRRAKTPHELEVIFNSNYDMFRDFENKDKEIDNINWKEILDSNLD